MSPLIRLEREAQRARQALSKLETQAVLAREKDESMPLEFWAAFGAAHVSVRLAERAVMKEREEMRKAQSRTLPRLYTSHTDQKSSVQLTTTVNNKNE